MTAQVHSPKREFRGVWLSTVTNIDWPRSRYDSDSKKQDDLRNYLIKLKDSGCNSVLFQVRCSCDAMYNSPYEPWSYWFSGEQGKGPSLDWDPLHFAVEEARKLGIELHAWVNPYRAVVNPNFSNNLTNSNYISDAHITKQQPDWILKFSDVHILDPGLPEVRTYIRDVLMDIVARYDIDGLHMDDYFYPYSVITNEDAATFAEHHRGFTDIQDWRRDNINLLVEAVMDSINKIKPWVKWGISPFGIYRPGIPSGITGLDAYNVLYCDPIAWLEAGTVDYITPQLYWPFGGGQDYGLLMPWWAQQATRYGKHFYPGQAMYRAGQDLFPRGEIPRQIRLNRETEHCDGSVFFTANNFFSNPKNTIDSLRLDLYRYPALWPVMTWKDSVPPAAPRNVQLQIAGDGSKTISWDAPLYGDPLDSAFAYVIYRSPYFQELPEDMSEVWDIQFHHNRHFGDSDPEMYYYMVTALDRNKLESVPGSIDYPFVILHNPQYAADRISKQIGFSWRNYSGAAEYSLRISDSDDLSSPLYTMTLTDTVKDMTLEYDTEYHWQIKADNTVYYSPVWKFLTELPPPVKTVWPIAYYEGTDWDVSLRWKAFENAASYHLRIANDPDMQDLVVQQSDIQDTAMTIAGMEPSTGYYWQVRSNKYDRWNDAQYFKTRDPYIGTVWAYASLTDSLPVFFPDAGEVSGLAVGTVNGSPLMLLVASSSTFAAVTVMDPANGELLDMTLDLSGIEGGAHLLRDIGITEDGVIYASNCALPGEDFKIYQWTDYAQPPVCVYRADQIAYRVGDHITVSGRLDDGSVKLYAPGSETKRMLKLEWNSVSQCFESEQINLMRTNKGSASMALIPDSDDFYINSTGEYLIRYSSAGMLRSWMSGNTHLPVNANATVNFSYGGKHFIAAYCADTESAHMVEISDGLKDARRAGSTYRLGIRENPGAVGDLELADNGDGTFNLYVLGSNNGLGAYRFDAASAMVNIAAAPDAMHFRLGANYPNPFNPVTVIPYTLDKNCDITIVIYDLNGRLVRTLYQGYQTAGTHQLRFDAAGLGSGVYICSMRSGKHTVSRKITFIK
ncbi:MAG: family 10 glycosylhydrolase [FCB group bacterium]|nr:family 10 glycosylhydrolase [FCB group bacterium]